MEPICAETLVICRIEGQDIQVLFTERNELQPELTISLVPKRDQALLFDNGNGQRIR